MLDKKYNHTLVEDGKFDKWLNEGYFNSGNLDKKPYTISMPPPNITGVLHLGHAWDYSIQDIIVRYKRMDGYDAFYVPGKDHAGIATQAKVDAKLKAEGIKPRDMAREEWMKHAWAWKEEHNNIINEQWAKLGISADYRYERFTLDEGLSNAVKEAFIEMYNKGLIYRGERIINFDPEAMTALSNIEVDHKEVEGYFYHLKYMIKGTDDYLEVATTRPETIFGDTALAVNPNDERYQHLIGKTVVVPIVNRDIIVVADDYADSEFGTGVVKITPAHDPNDFEVGNRHDLERILCMHPNGIMNEIAGSYQGLDRFECRKQLVKDLDESGLLIKKVPHTHSIGHSQRTGAMVEPYLSKQWFVKMDGLAKVAVEIQQDPNRKINFVPKRMEKTYLDWLTDIEDWCISRQLWWGHRIPAWYKEDQVYVGRENPGEGWQQDTDVLDTWFSSGLWPFALQGWPETINERYFPNDTLVTGYDIIFFWVARMIFQSLNATNQIPFKNVVLHGLIRDKEGRKMSKSLGNGVEPMEVIEEYGADALRFYLTTNSAPGQDLKYDEEKVKSTWNFINKIWNASRFCLMQKEDQSVSYQFDDLSITDKWMLTKLQKTIKQVRVNLDKFEFNNAGTELYKFIWEDFCDNYIELSKVNANINVLIYTLESILKLLHPFMPFVTEEIYQKLHNETIMLAEYPVYNKLLVFEEDEKQVNSLIEDITNIRNFKVVNNITKEAVCDIKTEDSLKLYYVKLLKLNEDNSNRTNSINFIGNLIDVTFKFDVTVDTDNLLAELIKEQAKLETSINKRKGLLNNTGYVSNAPQNLIDAEKTKLAEEEAKLVVIVNQINELNK